MKTKNIIICMLCSQVLTLLGFASYAVTLNTLQQEWHLSNFQSGFIASIFFFGYIDKLTNENGIRIWSSSDNS